MRKTICAPVLIVVTLLAAALAASSLVATETENQVLRILPAPGKVVVDGKFDDWDLTGGIFACGDVERLREHYGMWFHAMYDSENIYLLARWLDPTPLNNGESSKGGHGFAGDCLQVRFIAGYKTDHEVITWLTCWRDRDGIGVVTRESPDLRNCNRPCIRLPNLDNALGQGVQQAFTVNVDGKGYVQELAIPWKFLTADGKSPDAGEELRVTLEPNFTSEAFSRLTIKDIFRAGVVPDRVFSFRGYDCWGRGILEKAGHVTPLPLRLADEREFPVTLVDGRPAVDWSSLVTARELPGFKPLKFDMPFDGHVSLNLRDQDGMVVRQLLTDHPFAQGHHEVKWDGLPTPQFRTPGQPLPAGNYTWEALAHPELKLTLRGWAATAGIPWHAGPGTGWGGDHGRPSSSATDGEKIYLGWDEAESGKALIAVDAEGKVVWSIGSGTGGSVDCLAVGNGTVYGLGRGATMLHGHDIFRLRTSDGVFDNWQGRTTASLEIPQIWQGNPAAAVYPQRADGMDVYRTTLFLTFSDSSFIAEDIRSWKDFGAKLFEGGPIADRLLAPMNPEQRKKLVDYVLGKITDEKAMQGYPKQRFDYALLEGLNALRVAADVAPEAATLAGGERARANRRYLEKLFAPVLIRRKTEFLALCDAKSGKLRKTIDLPLPQAVHAVSDRLVYVISGGTTVLAVDLQSGKSTPLVAGLEGATSLAVDAQGRIYVGLGAPEHQVKIFSAQGQLVGILGRKGGRPLLGPWQADGFYGISSLVVDKQNRLWVTEADFHPKRVSVWDVPAGKPMNEFFGATHYGCSGAAIDPLDPNVMIAVGCEWRFDPKTQSFRCTGVFDRTFHGYAFFCQPANGRLYLAVNFEVEHNRSGLRVFERIGEGDYRLRAEIRPDFATKTTTIWSDANGDGKQDPGETVTVPAAWILYGSNCWSANLNPHDFTLFPVVFDAPQKTVYQLRSNGFTSCGAPRWDVADLKELAYAKRKEVNGILPSPDGRLLLTCGESNTDYRCYEMSSGRLLWKYPNPFFQVHGSHLAPAPEPGLTRGAYGFVGTFTHPNTGTVWVINGNLGEWYLLTEKGYFLARIFEGDPMQWKWPARAEIGADMTHCPPGGGGEDFGGSLAQTSDGTVYLQSGHTAVWSLELGNLDQVRVIGAGVVTLKPEEQALARAEFEKQSQRAVGMQACEVARLTPTVTGNLRFDFRAGKLLEYKKNEEAAVKSALAWDEKNLYLGFDVEDHSPWVNGAKEPAQMYVSGDTVDFQFGSDPQADRKRTEAVAGDLRISIGNFQGTPTAVLYRKVSAEKKPRNFTSGVVRQYEMDYVAVIADARIEVKIRPDKSGYFVEAAIPWSALGFVPQPGTLYRGDLGVTHGTATGDRTRLRTYWCNQETGLVDDAVFELKMTPRNWGQIVFKP
jgi:hypothetical protein